MRVYPFIGLLLLLWQLMISPVWGAEKSPKAKGPDIEPKASEILKQMCDYLKGLQQFSFQAENTEDVLLTSGQRIQYARSVEAAVRHPDRFRAESVGDTDNRLLVYDGKTITLMDRSKNFYTSIPSPPEIDAALEHGVQAFNLRAPLADLIYTKSYEYLTEGALSGFYVGLSKVQGVPCHHLAFREKDIDWQIWIEDGPAPLPRKFLITDKTAQGLQFTAVFTKWNTSPQFGESLFTFVAPEKAGKIDILPAAAPASPKKKQKR
ncbi:MAG: DUF2092 domain-containing protein [Deltaproteobacteria bacterium]|nr:DUF2092 domain-containing protein [Deltaproteobacteria bacterium]